MTSHYDTRFYTPGGPASVHADLNGLLIRGTRSLRIAVCFFTEPGRVLLRRHSSRLKSRGSFVVVSVDFPTNLKALEKLHRLAPGHVFIHMGGVTPEENKVGRSLMHSKIFLAEGDEACELWVGSHNLTGMAIAGGNFEAATLTRARCDSQLIQDAVEHLELCRTTAEVFNPDDMPRYQDIQNRRGITTWDSERNVLIIHAEAATFPTESSFIARVQIAPTELDHLIRNDRPVRLFLHRPGTLRAGVLVDYSRAELWTGEITAVVRTELHPKHRGAKGEFSSANYEIDVPDLGSAPVFRLGGHSVVDPRTQVVISVESRGEPGREVYSIGSKSPASFALEGANELELQEVDPEMAGYFTPDSVRDGRLIYRPVEDVREDFTVRGYEETVESRRGLPSALFGGENDDSIIQPQDKRGRRRARRPPVIRYETVSPTRPIDPFFYLSGYAIRDRQ
jgi:hypothetical protein